MRINLNLPKLTMPRRNNAVRVELLEDAAQAGIRFRPDARTLRQLRVLEANRARNDSGYESEKKVRKILFGRER